MYLKVTLLLTCAFQTVPTIRHPSLHIKIEKTEHVVNIPTMKSANSDHFERTHSLNKEDWIKWNFFKKMLYTHFKINLFIWICGWRSEDNLCDTVLSPTVWISETESKPLGLVPSAYTCWAIITPTPEWCLFKIVDIWAKEACSVSKVDLSSNPSTHRKSEERWCAFNPSAAEEDPRGSGQAAQ